jgi:hypothetical protein
MRCDRILFYRAAIILLPLTPDRGTIAPKAILPSGQISQVQSKYRDLDREALPGGPAAELSRITYCCGIVSLCRNLELRGLAEDTVSG